ncbi:hypothetical protein [Candidatus Nitrosocosmicus sp. R]
MIGDIVLVDYRVGTELRSSCEKGLYDAKLVTECFSRSILGGVG